MNKRDVIERIAAEADLTKVQAQRAYDAFLRAVELRRSHAGNDIQEKRSFRLEQLLNEREALLDAKFKGTLCESDQDRLAEIDRLLALIEVHEADEFDRGYENSRVGRIELALDRLEASIRSLSSDSGRVRRPGKRSRG